MTNARVYCTLKQQPTLQEVVHLGQLGGSSMTNGAAALTSMRAHCCALSCSTRRRSQSIR